MTEYWRPVSNHRLKRRALRFMHELREAQHLVRENGTGPTTRVLAAIELLADHGVHPTDHLRVARARVWSWRVYRDPQDGALAAAGEGEGPRCETSAHDAIVEAYRQSGSRLPGPDPT